MRDTKIHLEITRVSSTALTVTHRWFTNEYFRETIAVVVNIKNAPFCNVTPCSLVTSIVSEKHIVIFNVRMLVPKYTQLQVKEHHINVQSSF